MKLLLPCRVKSEIWIKRHQNKKMNVCMYLVLSSEIIGINGQFLPGRLFFPFGLSVIPWVGIPVAPVLAKSLLTSCFALTLSSFLSHFDGLCCFLLCLLTEFSAFKHISLHMNEYHGLIDFKRKFNSSVFA